MLGNSLYFFLILGAITSSWWVISNPNEVKPSFVILGKKEILLRRTLVCGAQRAGGLSGIQDFPAPKRRAQNNLGSRLPQSFQGAPSLTQNFSLWNTNGCLTTVGDGSEG